MKREAMLYEKLESNRVHCFLCSHHCKINPSQFGICGVRQNIGGTLYTYAYGELISHHINPIEKKPFYHFLPGTGSYSITTVGCNFRCGFCQNWEISQTSYKNSASFGEKMSPEEIVKEAKKAKCESISYTFTEPAIFFEYAYETARLAKSEGLYNNFVTNGYITREALEIIQPYLDACNVDLKSFSEDFYRRICKARLEPVLNSIKVMRELNIWVEVTTLIVPGENDSDDELKCIAQFIASVDKGIPWHISRFHPDYQFTNHQPTPMKTLEKVMQFGKSCGLHYVYLGNVFGYSDTYCYNCNALLIKRSYMCAEEINLKNGHCPKCGVEIEGVWK